MSMTKPRGRVIKAESVNPPTAEQAQAMIANAAPQIAELVRLYRSERQGGYTAAQSAEEVDAILGVFEEEA